MEFQWLLYKFVHFIIRLLIVLLVALLFNLLFRRTTHTDYDDEDDELPAGF